jgi:hypothetical protein
MMIANKKEFYGGLALLVAFTIVLTFIFMPVFKGHNALQYMDALYNSISKGSAYYIPAVRTESSSWNGTAVDVSLPMADPEQAAMTAKLFSAGGATVDMEGQSLRIRGDLGAILANSLDDADNMYFNRGEVLSGKYGYGERHALYNWWRAFQEMDKALKAQKHFKEAKAVSLVANKALETSYNYYTIEPQNITDRMGIVIFSLVFYVVYTLWYGFAILFMFEGWGMALDH